VWDAEFVYAAHQVRRIREALLDELEPQLADTYSSLAGQTTPVSLEFLPSSTQPLDQALHAVLRDDIQRGYSTIGPHRDDFRVLLEHRDARRQASQGEQRSLALALRLAAHELVSRSGRSPLILLDDVFSELDPSRASRLIDLLPVGQTLVTTATPLADAFADAFIIDVRKNS
jgi:DNA replication and repair protein RecF